MVTWALFLALLLIPSSIGLEKKTETNKCDSNPLPVSEANGTLNIDSSGHTGVSCIWNFNGSQTGYLVIVAQVANLHAKDTIDLKEKNGNVIGKFNSSTTPGIFVASLTSPESTLTITLDAESKDTQRNIKYNFAIVKDLTKVNVTASDANEFVIPLNAPSDKPIPAPMKVNIQPPSTKTAFVQVIESNVAYDLDGHSDTDSLTSQSHPSVLTINQLTNTSRVLLAFQDVDPGCSEVIELKDTTSKVIPFNLTARNANVFSQCTKIVRSSLSGVLVNLTSTDSLASDSIIFYQGSHVNPSAIKLQVFSSNFNEEKVKLSNKLLGGNSIIVYRGFPGKNSVSTISLTATDNSKVNIQDVNVAANELVAYESSTGKRVSFTRKENGPVEAHFYCHDDSTSPPFLTILSDQSFPSTIYSPTSFLRVTGMSGTLTGHFDELAANDLNTTICEQSATLTFEPQPTNLTKIVIPSRPGKEVLVRVPSVYLLQDHDNLSIHRLEERPFTVLSEMYNSSHTEAFLPSIRLRGDIPHEIIYSRVSTPDKSERPFEISVAYVDPVKPVEKLLSLNETFVITQPSSFLDYYEPSGPNKIQPSLNWKAKATNTSQFVHLSISKFNLGTNQTLSIIGGGGDDQYTDSSYIVPDHISSESAILLQSLLPPSNVRGASGSGFVATYRSIACGSVLSYPGVKQLTTNSSETDCVWVVKSDNNTLLKMNVSIMGDAKLVDLRIVDEITSSSVHFVNTSLLNETLISSTNGVVILYRVNSNTSVPTLKITLDHTTCAAMANDTRCDKGTRCILPHFRCDGVKQCDDGLDEEHCMSSPPQPTPTPCVACSGVSGWVIILFIIPMSIFVGVFGILYGPRVIGRFRNSRYSDFSNLAEDT